MRADNQRLMTWLNYYGMMRLSLMKVGDAAHAARLDPEEATEYFQAYVNTALSRRAIAAADSEAAMDKAKTILSVIPFGAILTTVLDIALAVITPWFNINKQFGCDEHKCKGNIDYDRRHYTGIYPPPGRRTPGAGAGTPIQRFFHDGLVFPLKPTGCDMAIPKSGQFKVNARDNSKWKLLCSRNLPIRYVGDFTYEVIPAADLYPGKAFGVLALRYVWESSVRKFRNRRSFPRHLAGVIPEGSKGAAWASAPNTFWYRTWAITRLLRWLQDAVPCRNLVCLSSTLTAMRELGPELEDPQTARKTGGMWFASLYYMHKDFSVLVSRIGRQKTNIVLQQVGAGAAIGEFAKPQTTTNEDKPYGWPWWRVSKLLSFEQLSNALVKMAPHDPRGGMTARPKGKAPNPFDRPLVAIEHRAGTFKWTTAHSVGTAMLGGLALLAYTQKKR